MKKYRTAFLGLFIAASLAGLLALGKASRNEAAASVARNEQLLAEIRQERQRLELLLASRTQAPEHGTAKPEGASSPVEKAIARANPEPSSPGDADSEAVQPVQAPATPPAPLMVGPDGVVYQPVKP